ncbi:MAG: cytochrome c biogenesis protein CcdA [Dehalococcoidia bacterium]|nr:cytochrome c biogenesis protein CcdA [Dehalococcoidia bacterium]
MGVEQAAEPGAWQRLVGRGYPRSLLVGATFSVAWTPCIGPILGVLLTLAATTGSWQQGGLLLVFYSLGLGVWFMAFGAFFGWLSPRMKALRPHMQKLMVAAGVVFIAVGALMFLGEFQRLNEYFQSAGFLFEGPTAVEEDLSGSVEGWFGPAIAFFGGVVSFLSPCVLPLVPVYLVNVAGEAALGTTEGVAGRARVLGNSLAFVVGFTAVFAVIGASAGFAGGAVTEHLDLLTRIGGVVLMVLGMQMAGLIHVPYLDRTYQLPA